MFKSICKYGVRIAIIASLSVFMLVFAACGTAGGGAPAPGTPAPAPAPGAAPAEAGSPATIAGLAEEDEVETLVGAGDITLRLTWLSGGGLNRDGIRQGLAPFIEETGIGVDIIYVTGNWAEYFTKLQLMIAAGENLDLANVAIEGFEMLVQLGLAQPIDDWIARNPDTFNAVAGDVSPAVMNVMNFGGRQYGIPNEWNNVVTHFRTDLLEEAGLPFPPADWDKDLFLYYAQRLTYTRDDGTRQFGVFVPNSYFVFQSWLFNNGTTYMSEDFTQSNLDDPRVAEMLQFMYDLIYVYEVAPIPEAGLSAIPMLVQGDVAMMFAGRWPTNQYVEAGLTDVAIPYVPTFRAGYGDVVWGGTGVFTLAGSAHPDEATKLAVHLASETFIEQFMGAGAIPTLTSLAERLVPALGVPQNYRLFIDSAAYARSVQAPAQYAEVSNMMSMVFSDVLVSRRDVETVLAEAHAQLNFILMDNR